MTDNSLYRPVEIHQLHLRPADFFTSNPALDVPSKRNEASVLVPCCGLKDQETAASGDKRTSVQDEPQTHLQGGGPDIDAETAGAHVEGKQSSGEEKTSRRLSKAFSNLLKLGKDQ